VRGDGVEDGVHGGWCAGDGAAFADALAPSGFVVLGTGLKSILIGGIMSARGMPYSISEPVSSTVTSR
jgi:hypothetical protein